jgi:hypothetical protein
MLAEKRDPIAEHDGHEVDHDLVEEPGVETFPREPPPDGLISPR